VPLIEFPDRLPQELLDICKETFNTHIAMEGMTARGVDHKYRKTEVRYIQRTKKEQPRGIQLLEDWVSEQGYPNLTPEILQIARYHETNFYDWHSDSNGNKGYRKLSMSCLLNDSSEFTGGDLEFELPDRMHREGIILSGQKTVVKLEEGMPVLFQPEIRHKVHIVESGIRDSLVVWFFEKDTDWERNMFP